MKASAYVVTGALAFPNRGTVHPLIPRGIFWSREEAMNALREFIADEIEAQGGSGNPATVQNCIDRGPGCEEEAVAMYDDGACRMTWEVDLLEVEI